MLNQHVGNQQLALFGFSDFTLDLSFKVTYRDDRT